MYIYNQPQPHQPLEGEHAPGRSGAMNTEPSSSSSQSPHLHQHHQQQQHVSSSSAAARQGPARTPLPASSLAPPEPQVVSLKHSSLKSRRHSLPFSFPPLFFKPSNNTSSTSLVPSTAEGKAIPLDNDTTAHRTSALRELNSNYPSSVSRRGYAKSTGAQNSTYSQPVIVRTYSGPSPLQGHSRSNSHAGSYRPPSASRAGSRRIPYSASSTSTSYFSPSAHTKPIKAPQNGSLLSMARGNAKKKSPWSWRQDPEPQPDPAKLPPLEAYSFKSFMATFEEQHSDIGADLDRIAEICARSRYSLSNQYEVHVKPHGSGTSFVASSVPSSSRRRGHGRNSQREPGPTLQAIQSDDDESSNARSHRKRRSGARRRSVAYGTLETIMSSSRSSEEDKTKKKSAAEIAEEVRGRAARKSTDSKSGGSASGSPSTGAVADKSTSGTTSQAEPKTPARKKSTSFANAIIHAENTRQHPDGDVTSPRNSASALVSLPALPQTSSSHLEIRTAPDDLYDEDAPDSQPQSPHSSAGSETLFSPPLPLVNESKTASGSLLSGLSNLIPWRTAASGAGGSTQPGHSTKPSHAEGSLRDLLKTVNSKQDKGKSVERAL